ncbi:hypothetical protein [Streptomyces canus]
MDRKRYYAPQREVVRVLPGATARGNRQRTSITDPDTVREWLS